MRYKLSLVLLIFSLWTVSCAPAVDNISQAATSATEQNLPAAGVTDLPASAAPEATAAPTCAADDVRKLAESIAADYPFTNTDEILTWFCNGAEFEDIMVALQTEDLTGTPAEDLLKMRADDLAWDEIWQAVGLTK